MTGYIWYGYFIATRIPFKENGVSEALIVDPIDRIRRNIWVTMSILKIDYVKLNGKCGPLTTYCFAEFHFDGQFGRKA